MRALRAFFHRVAGLFGKERREQELAAEIESHLLLHMDDNLRDGMDRKEALRQARLKFGAMEATKEEYRERRSVPVFENLMQDLRYAGRALRRSPGFAAVAMLSLGLGIGANTAIFSVVNAVLLRPLPYADPQRLVLAWTDLRNRNVLDFPLAAGDFDDLRRGATLFEGFAGVLTGRQVVAGDNGDPEPIRTGAVTPNFFRLLGARIALGRDFEEQDATPQPQAPAGQAATAQNAPARLPTIAILSHELWQRRYGKDPGVLGRSIEVGGGRAQVVGVLAPGFELLFPPRTGMEHLPEVWMAMRLDFERMSRIQHILRVIGRLKPGVNYKRAQGQVDVIAAELRQRFPIKETAGMHFRLEPMHADLVSEVRPAIVALMGAVSFLLLIACANVANLQLVRASLRGRELAVRAALGGNRGRLVRQLLAETLVLAGGGALLGLGLAQLGIRLLIAIGPASLPRLDSVGIDPLVLGFTTLAALVAAAIFGVAPALRASRPDLMDVLRASGRTAGLGGGRLLRNGVVVAEVALSFVLLIGCGLMLRSFVALQRAEAGFDPRGVLTFLVPGIRGTAEQRAAFMRDLRGRLTALPGVQAASAASPLPLDGSSLNGRWGTEEALANPGKFQQGNIHIVLPGYFETLRTRLIAGRTFTDADNAPQRMVVIIDQLLAAKAFPNGPAVGQRLLVRPRAEEPEWVEVIGVVAHQRHASLAADGREAMFFTDGFMGHGRAARWAVRTAGDPALLAPAIRAEVARLDSRLPVAEVQPMRALVERAQAQTRFALVLIGVFAALAAVLAAVGLYGVLATAVRQRTAEIGVRMALGAAPGSIFRLVVGQGIRLSAMGIGLGLLGAFHLTSIMSTMLVGVKPTDPATFASMVAVFLLIAAVACWAPARRAARLDPTTALREE